MEANCILLLLAGIFATASGQQCYQCGNTEPSNFCNATAFATTCADRSQACYISVRNENSRLYSQKGCLPIMRCQDLSRQNGRFCSEGVVTPDAPCHFCCTGDKCNRDAFNYGVTRTTTNSPPIPTRRPVGPSLPGGISRDIEACLADYQQLVNKTVSNSVGNFPTFCRELPFILFCLSTAQCQDEAERKKSEQIANHLWSLCPRDCDVTAGDNCTAQFVSAMTDIVVFGDGDQCADIQREVGQYVSCIDYNVGSCEGATAQRFALTLQAIKRESDVFCVANLEEAAPTPPSDPADCEAQMAAKRIATLTTKILQLLYGGHDVSAYCTTHIPNTEQYLQKALASCSSTTSTRVRAAFQVAKNLLGLACDNVTPPPLCDIAEARKCIVDFWTMVDEADDAEKYCSLIKPTQECVKRYTAGCKEKEREELENLLQIFLDRIEDKCEDVIEPTAPCGQNITLIEGGPVHQLQFKMVKSPDEVCQGLKDCQVYVDVVIQNVDGPKCPDGTDAKQVVCKEDNGQPCSRHITNAIWQRAITFHLAAVVDTQKDGIVTVEVNIVVRKVINGVTSEWRTVCTVQVYVVDQDKPTGGHCASSNDPHLHTFDQWYYNNYMQGLFLMYRHKQLPYEVQAIFQPCNKNLATCNCGVAVRSGDFVFVVESCQRRASVCDKSGRHVCNTHGQMRMYTFGDAKDPAMKIFTQGPNIEVILPQGTRVSIQHDQLHRLFNFVIYASVFDWGTNMTEGLCGNFDGRMENDLTLSTGEVYQPQGHERVFPDHFSASWRLRADQSIFSGISGIKYRTPKYCSSKTHGDNNCDVTGLVEYCHLPLGQEVPLPRITVAPNNLQVQPNGRKRRATDTDLLDIIEINNDNNTSPQSPPVMSEAEATAFCQNYLNSKEEWSQWCLTLPNANNSLRMRPCVDDLMLTGDRAWADTALEGFKHDCMTQLTKDAEYLETFAGRLMKEKIMSLTCPNMCSGNGVCSDGKCQCQAPYTGYDCSSSPQNTIPQFLSLFEDGLCDVTRGNCSNVVLYGTSFVDSPSLTCHFVGVEVTSDGSKDLGTKFDVEATFISDNQILCPTPSLATPGGQVAWTIDVSNDAINPSLSPVFLVSHDPRCALCRMDSANKTATCQKMEESCIIDNKCFSKDQINPKDSCQRCDPSYSTTKWNNKTLCTLNIAALVICLLLFFLLLGIIIYCVCRCTKSCQKSDDDKSVNSETKNFNVADSKPVRLTQR